MEIPKIQEHCESCFKKYGYTFEEIHYWMDEPHQISGSSHQQFRHNQYKTPLEAEHIFWESTPEKFRRFIRDAVLDHIILDKTDTNKSRKLGDSNKYSVTSVCVPPELFKWLKEHPELNKSKIFQDGVEKLIHGDNYEKLSSKVLLYLKILILISILTNVGVLLNFILP